MPARSSQRLRLPERTARNGPMIRENSAWSCGEVSRSPASCAGSWRTRLSMRLLSHGVKTNATTREISMPMDALMGMGLM